MCRDLRGRSPLIAQASTSDPIPKREVAKPDGGFYDKTGKTVVNAQAYVVAWPLCSCAVALMETLAIWRSALAG